MMVDKTTAVHFIQESILRAVDFSKKEKLQNIKLDQKEDE
jgi:hypothetical protein